MQLTEKVTNCNGCGACDKGDIESYDCDAMSDLAKAIV